MRWILIITVCGICFGDEANHSQKEMKIITLEGGRSAHFEKEEGLLVVNGLGPNLEYLVGYASESVLAKLCADKNGKIEIIVYRRDPAKRRERFIVSCEDFQEEFDLVWNEQ